MLERLLRHRASDGSRPCLLRGQNRKYSRRAYVFRFAPESGHCAAQSACPFRCPNPDIATASLDHPVGTSKQRTGIALAKKATTFRIKLMRCNRVAETTPNAKRYITVRFDGLNSDERRALHSATSLARQNASPLARSPRYSAARIGGCCDGRCCVGRGGTDLLARVTGASALM